MTVQITIIGLGQIGASIGLALADQKAKVTRVGHDRDPGVARQAEKKGALDKVIYNLPSAVRQADLVILALPTDQIHDTLEIIASELKESAVVMDTSPIKETVMGWVKELLPPDRHYVGLMPVINPAYLHTNESGVEAAQADLFQGGLMAIVVPPSTATEAVKLAADLVRLLGSNPLFADAVEVDSLMAATHTLPQLLAACLLNATVDQPGWREGRKLAGKAYAEVTSPITQLGSSETLSNSAVLAQEHMVRVINNLIVLLQIYRDDIQNKDTKSLTEKLERARKGREDWWNQRKTSHWTGEEVVNVSGLPKSSDFFARLVGLGRRKEKPKK